MIQVKDISALSVRFAGFGLALSLLGCSSGSTEQPDKVGNSQAPFVEPDRVHYVGYGGDYVKNSKRFVAFSRAAERLAVVNPKTTSEIWTRSLPDRNYEWSVPLGSFEGAALLNDDHLAVVTASGTKRFSLDADGLALWNVSADGEAFAFQGPAGGLRIVKYLGEGQWQNKSFANPFSNDTPSPYLLVWNDDKTEVVAVARDGAHYARFTAGGARQPQQAPDEVCQPQKSLGDLNGGSLTTGLYDSKKNRYVLGTSTGHVLSASASDVADCTAPTTWQQIALNTEAPVIRLAQADSQTLLVSQFEGPLTEVVTKDEGLEAKKSTEVCQAAISISRFKGHYGVLCALPDEQKGFSRGNQALNVSKLDYRALSRKTGEVTHEISLEKRDLINLWLDTEAGRILLFENSGLGNLKSIDLESGKTTRKVGIFTDDILERL